MQNGRGGGNETNPHGQETCPSSGLEPVRSRIRRRFSGLSRTVAGDILTNEPVFARKGKSWPYMPTLMTIEHNAAIGRFYLRMLGEGKAKMTGVVAAMRKLITTLNTMVAKNEAWRQNFA